MFRKDCKSRTLVLQLNHRLKFNWHLHIWILGFENVRRLNVVFRFKCVSAFNHFGPIFYMEKGNIPDIWTCVKKFKKIQLKIEKTFHGIILNLNLNFSQDAMYQIFINYFRFSFCKISDQSNKMPIAILLLFAGTFGTVFSVLCY